MNAVNIMRMIAGYVCEICMWGRAGRGGEGRGAGRGKRYIIQASRSSATSSRLITHHSRSHLVIFSPWYASTYVRTYVRTYVSVDHCSLTSRLRIDGILLFLANVAGIIATYLSALEETITFRRLVVFFNGRQCIGYKSIKWRSRVALLAYKSLIAERGVARARARSPISRATQGTRACECRFLHEPSTLQSSMYNLYARFIVLHYKCCPCYGYTLSVTLSERTANDHGRSILALVVQV